MADCTARFMARRKGDPALQLLRDAFGDQRRVDFGLAHLNDVEMHLGVGHLGEIWPRSLFDIRALLADQDTRAGGVNR